MAENPGMAGNLRVLVDAALAGRYPMQKKPAYGTQGKPTKILVNMFQLTHTHLAGKKPSAPYLEQKAAEWFTF